MFVFDFDGTLTRRDTFLELIGYAFGRRRLFLGLLLYSPVLVLMKLHLFSNSRAKELVFGHFFRGMAEERFRKLCEDFASERKDLLRPSTTAVLRNMLSKGEACYVVSASSPAWVEPMLRDFQGVKVTGTEWETKDGLLTGRMATPNCYGKEKVRRLMELVPDLKTKHIVAYGDSRGDKEIMEIADERHYRDFD